MTTNATTIPTSNPTMILDGFASGIPRIFCAQTTAVSSAIIATGYWAGQGYGGRGGYQSGMAPGDLLVHTQVSTAGVPVKATLHAVISSTANASSSQSSSSWAAFGYDVTIATAT